MFPTTSFVSNSFPPVSLTKPVSSEKEDFTIIDLQAKLFNLEEKYNQDVTALKDKVQCLEQANGDLRQAIRLFTNTFSTPDDCFRIQQAVRQLLPHRPSGTFTKINR